MCFVAYATKRNGRVTNPPAIILYDYPFLLSIAHVYIEKGIKKAEVFYASAYLFNRDFPHNNLRLEFLRFSYYILGKSNCHRYLR